MPSSEGGGGKAKKWIRFKEPLVQSTWYWSSNNDSIMFIPKRNIVFHGFGVYCSKDSQNLRIKTRWAIGEDDDSNFSDWHDVTFEYENRDDLTKTHDLYLKDLGVKPVKVAAG